MKILILSKALITGIYQRKLEILASTAGVEVVAVVPPTWREPGVGVLPLERAFTEGYRLLVRPIALNGNFHLFFWPSLGRVLRKERPHILHIDEESFNLATFQAMWLGRRLGARCLFFNWANLFRRLPPPFCWFERYNLSHAKHAVAGNRDAAEVLRRKGYTGPLSIIPQFGVDEQLFRPMPHRNGRQGEGMLVGYVGRLVPQKGVSDLVEAMAGLPPSVHLLMVGRGALEPHLRQRAEELGLSQRIEFAGHVPSSDVPDLLRHLDVLVLPSRTTPTWKEQFGRVLVEAMACGVPVLGSDSGEIPHVIGEAGLLFPEGNVTTLRKQLGQLADDAELREALGQRGRERVLAHYTHERVVQAYLDVYREMLR
jgi:glycosyltransferase involved in cell wall biosynthesis